MQDDKSLPDDLINFVRADFAERARGAEPHFNIVGTEKDAEAARLVDLLIHKLLEWRASAPPPIPHEVDLSKPFAHFPGARFHVGDDYQGRCILSLRHPGIGWFSVPLRYEDRENLIQLLRNPGSE